MNRWRVDDHVCAPGDGGGRWFLYDLQEWNDGPPEAEFYDEEKVREVARLLNEREWLRGLEWIAKVRDWVRGRAVNMERKAVEDALKSNPPFRVVDVKLDEKDPSVVHATVVVEFPPTVIAVRRWHRDGGEALGKR